ncbi:MBL fold metallo-hydrolase [Chloroflexota bacterium]
MVQELIPIKLALPYRTGNVNCYLVKTDTGFILVDTGSSKNCKELDSKLEQFGCNSGNLRLIILTHGDFDHTGNAAYIRRNFNTKIAMHSEDSQIVERGHMFLNRKKGNFFQNWIIKTLVRFGKSQRFTPDLYITSEFTLSEYGLNAEVIHIPGHSKGSIGILTADGKLFCGDLLANSDKIDKPTINPIMDDVETANRSIEMLKNLKVDIVYPGHGKPFTMNSFLTQLNN